MKPGRDKINAIVLIVVIVFGSIVWSLKKCKESSKEYPDRTVTNSSGDWRHQKLIYTKHARCRMECREITEAEVEFILADGVVNEEKSKEVNEEAQGHCPTYALEGNTKDGQHVRIVFGACEKITKVVTAIDLGVEHVCNCR